MTNIYVLASSDLSSPWTRISTYDGNYIRFSTSGFGTEAGNAQHRHQSVECESGVGTIQMSSGSYTAMRDHTHTIAATYSGYSDNDPLYYTLSLWYMDATIWEASVRGFPANTVVPSYSSISSPGYSRFTSADGYLIKLGDSGSSGGRSSHTDHSISVTLTAKGVWSGAAGSSAGNVASGENHGHTATIASVSDSSIFPAYVKTRFYYTTVETKRAPAGIVCFFDGAPSGNWTLVSDWENKFIMSYDGVPAEDGSDAHGHTASGTSSSFTGYNLIRISSIYEGTAKTHSHSVSLTLGSPDELPLYVQLVPYKLEVDIYVRSGRPLMW
jgi:hypothetical protein